MKCIKEGRTAMPNETSYDVVVVGGGPAGLLCGWAAAERGLSVAVLDRFAPGLPKKLLIAGKGRCNITNACGDEDFFRFLRRGDKFMRSCYRAFGCSDVMAWFEAHGVPLKVERGGRVFPQSDRAGDIAEALVDAAKSSGAVILPGRAQRIETADGAVSGVVLADGRRLCCRAAVLATGGLSYPGTGSDGDGFRIAKELGHTVTPLSGSLVPLVCREDDCRELQGLSLRNVALHYPAEGKRSFSEQGELLFTHFGLSGPLVLTLSTGLAGRDIAGQQVSIDLKPALERDKLDKRVLRDFSENSNRAFKNSLDALLPKSLIPVVVRRTGIDPDKKINSVTAAERARLVDCLKDFRLTLERARPVAEAIVTAGGVELREVQPKTMMSRLVRNLHFAGEVLDVDGITGGFNLTIAFSTGYAAGSYILKEENGI